MNCATYARVISFENENSIYSRFYQLDNTTEVVTSETFTIVEDNRDRLVFVATEMLVVAEVTALIGIEIDAMHPHREIVR